MLHPCICVPTLPLLPLLLLLLPLTPSPLALQITDRSKDVIKSGGEWISSVVIENVAVGHPQVAGALCMPRHAVPGVLWPVCCAVQMMHDHKPPLSCPPPPLPPHTSPVQRRR